MVEEQHVNISRTRLMIYLVLIITYFKTYLMISCHPYAKIWMMVVAIFISLPAIGQYHVKPFDISKKITALQHTENGTILYGTESGEFGEYDGLQFYRIDNVEAKIHSIEIEGNIKYLCTSKGLYEIKEGRSVQISRNNLDVLARSKDNSFLVTSDGVYNGFKTEYIPNKEDFFDINEIEFGDYFTLGDVECFRADNKVFVKNKRWNELITHAERDFGIIPWSSNKMLIADRKALVTFDQEGYVDTLLHLGFDTNNKIFKLQASNILFCSDNSIGVFDMRKKELNNFYSLNTELITAVTVDEWGNIWIAAGSYLFQVIDRSSDTRNQPPKIAIEAIRINGTKEDLSAAYRLEEKENEIEIDYSGVHMTFPQNLEFQTLLSGKNQSIHYDAVAEGEWSVPTKDRNIEYRNLKAGKYSFQLRGTVDGQYYMYTKPIVFNVESNVFQSIWLFGILGALGVLLVAIFFNNRYNNLKQKSDRDRNRLIQENKMLTLQQKALQLQMNPHFVFNSLNSIQGLIANEDNQKARRYLQEFSTMMRSVLNQSREETIVLNEEVKYLKSYLNLEQMANNNKFDWEVEVDSEVEDDIRIPTMIIQPFVENAVLHGVRTLKERRGKISLIFEMEGSKIRCKVIDNGIGRKAAALLKSSSHKSVALDVVKERLSSKLKTSRDRPIRYNDVLDDANNSIGTEVLISIPIMN